MIKKYIINERIRAKEVRLIDDEGKQVGIIEIEKARDLVEKKGLDLLLVSPDANPPVCRMIDFGQFRYEQQKKEKQARKSSKTNVVKELKFSPKISEHDYQVRMTSGKKFLQKGYKIKLSVFFKGREATHPEIGSELLKRYISEIEELGTQEGNFISSRRSIIAFVNPK